MSKSIVRELFFTFRESPSKTLPRLPSSGGRSSRRPDAHPISTTCFCQSGLHADDSFVDKIMCMRASTLRRSVRPMLRTLLARQMSTASTGRSTTSTGSVIYEGKRAVDEYLQMHYGAETDVFPYGIGAVDGLNFPKRCADELHIACKSNGLDPVSCNALDVGCAVGGATFELARHFCSVDGVDFSRAFVAAAESMQRDGQLSYRALVEGSRSSSHVARLPDNLRAEDIAKVRFSQGDACALEELRDAGWLKADGYDAVLASNLLCRLPRPRAFLSSCAQWAVKPGGVLVLLTPFSWLEQWTAREEWIGGGESVSSDRLQAQMSTLGFELISRADVPFLIREHARKFQYGVSECSVWKRS